LLGRARQRRSALAQGERRKRQCPDARSRAGRTKCRRAGGAQARSGKTLDKAGNALSDVADDVKNAADEAGPKLKNAADDAGAAVKDAGDKIGHGADKAADDVKDQTHDNPPKKK